MESACSVTREMLSRQPPSIVSMPAATGRNCRVRSRRHSARILRPCGGGRRHRPSERYVDGLARSDGGGDVTACVVKYGPEHQLRQSSRLPAAGLPGSPISDAQGVSALLPGLQTGRISLSASCGKRGGGERRGRSDRGARLREKARRRWIQLKSSSTPRCSRVCSTPTGCRPRTTSSMASTRITDCGTTAEVQPPVRRLSSRRSHFRTTCGMPYSFSGRGQQRRRTNS